MKKINLEISEESVPFILQAFESFIRAKLMQFDYWVEETFPKESADLDWTDRKDINMFLRQKLLKDGDIFKENLNASKGIYHEDSIENGATAIYELLQVLREYQSVKNNNGFWGFHKGFDEPLSREIGENVGKSGINLPKVVNFDKFVDVVLEKKHWDQIGFYLSTEQYKKMWNYFDQNIGKKYDCEKIEIIEKNGAFFVRYHKPRKLEENL